MAIERHRDKYAEPWFWMCYDNGVHPREADSDDVFGPFDPTGFRDSDGQRVTRYNDAVKVMDFDEMDPGGKFDIEAIAAMSGLTGMESEVVWFILNGVSVKYKGYAVYIGAVLGVSPTTVRVHWRNAKKKLKNSWLP